MAGPHNPLDLHDLLNYFLVRRIGFFLGNTNHVIAASGISSTFDGMNPAAGIVLGNGQAMRVVDGQCSCFDNASTGKIICQSMNFSVSAQGLGSALRAWQLNAVGYPLYSNGVVVNVPPDGFFFFDDYAEQGGVAGKAVFAAIGVDATNSDATTPHTLTVNGAVTVELWQYTPNAMRGG